MHLTLNNQISACLYVQLNSQTFLFKVKLEHFMHTQQSKMKIFKRIQKNLVTLGINPNESSPFNWKIMIVFLLLGLGIILNVMFIFPIKDKDLMDYVKVFTIITVLIQLCICMAGIVLQQTKLFVIIGRFEKIINKSNLLLINEFEGQRENHFVESNKEIIFKILGLNMKNQKFCMKTQIKKWRNTVAFYTLAF